MDKLLKQWAPDQRFYDLDGESITGAEVIFHGRVNNDGLSVIPCDPSGPPGWYKVFCLSITYGRWIATNGFSTYIVELRKKEQMASTFVSSTP